LHPKPTEEKTRLPLRNPQISRKTALTATKRGVSQPADPTDNNFVCDAKFHAPLKQSLQKRAAKKPKHAPQIAQKTTKERARKDRVICTTLRLRAATRCLRDKARVSRLPPDHEKIVNFPEEGCIPRASKTAIFWAFLAGFSAILVAFSAIFGESASKIAENATKIRPQPHFYRPPQ